MLQTFLKKQGANESGANERVILIPHVQEYPDLQNISTSILSGILKLRVIARGDIAIFQKAGATKGIRRLVRCTHNIADDSLYWEVLEKIVMIHQEGQGSGA